MGQLDQRPLSIYGSVGSPDAFNLWVSLIAGRFQSMGQHQSLNVNTYARLTLQDMGVRLRRDASHRRKVSGPSGLPGRNMPRQMPETNTCFASRLGVQSSAGRCGNASGRPNLVS